jgi:signal transduction histidine kinase
MWADAGSIRTMDETCAHTPAADEGFFGFFANLFHSAPFMPHLHCYMQRGEIIALNVVSDLCITLAYYSIPVVLLWFVWKRRDVPFHWMFILFGIFIFGCGTTHLFDVITVWEPVYRASALVKVGTAIVSLAAATMLVPIIPKALAMPSLQAANDQLHRSEDNLRQLTRRMLALQDEERRRLAKDLHDSSAQELAALAMNLGLMQQQVRIGNPAMDKLMNDSLAITERCSRGIRTISYLLHPPLLDEMGLASAIRHYAEGFMQRSGIAVDIDIPTDARRLPYEIERTLFRIAQEALGNIHRHSASSTASVRLQVRGGNATLEIADSGRGFPADMLENVDRCDVPLGVGILGMRERLQQLGGRLELASDDGAVVKATVPIAEPAGPVA